MGRTKVVYVKQTPKAKAKQEKAQRAADAAARNKAEQDTAKRARDAKAQAVADKKRAVDADKAEFANTQIRNWNQQINQVVDQVLAIRAANAGVAGINAGSNGNRGTTEGGTENPLILAWPSGAPGKLTKGDALCKLAGYDQSDSADIKVRRKNVLVHIR